MSRSTLDTVMSLIFSRTGLSPSMAGFPKTILLSYWSLIAVLTPECTHPGLGSFHFARRYFGNRCFFLFLWLLRCFSSPGSLYLAMDSLCSDRSSSCRVSPFRYLRVKWIFAPNRSFSQLITSFIGSQCQGIHPALFLA